MLLRALSPLWGAGLVLAALARGAPEPLNVSGVSGTRFTGETARRLPREELSFSGLRRSDIGQMATGKHCERWIVVTTIYQSSPATRKLGEMTRQGWCFVVVADVNGPPEYDDVEGAVYLTVQQQRALHFRIVHHIPWRHFGRKNVGYLYAIAHGARVIYDTDDDNRLKESTIPLHGVDAASLAPLASSAKVLRPLDTRGDARLFNPYPSFAPSCGHIWPRGLPLDFVQGKGVDAWPLEEAELARPPAVQQFLADEDPDVDAVFRLTRKLPCSFGGLAGQPADAVLSVPARVFTPYNAQATVHLYEAFWGLLLPVTVHGRVSDIWRAYLTEKLLWDVGQSVAFHTSHVVHDRVAHDYLKDFASEQPLYFKATALVSFLSGWSSDAPTLVERLEQLWVELYERDFVELGDVRLVQAWIKDLIAVGYKFPDLRVGKIMWASGAKAEL